MARCSKCGCTLAGIFASSRTIRGEEYCSTCAKTVPSCDKCKYHYRSDIHPKYGCCAYFNQYLQDYDNTCSAYGTGRQVHEDVTL